MISGSNNSRLSRQGTQRTPAARGQRSVKESIASRVSIYGQNKYVYTYIYIYLETDRYRHLVIMNLCVYDISMWFMRTYLICNASSSVSSFDFLSPTGRQLVAKGWLKAYVWCPSRPF